MVFSGFKELLQFKWTRISAAVLLGGLFIGYNLAFLDFTLIPFPILVPYLAKETSFGYPYIPPLLDKLDYVKYTLAEAVVLVGGGVLIGLTTVGTLFVLGLSVGSSLPPILEYSGTLIIAQSVIFIIFFVCSLIFLGTSGLSLGAPILHLARNTAWKIDRRTYDAFLLGLLFLILAVVVEAL